MTTDANKNGRQDPDTEQEPAYDDRWRETHLGRLLGHAMRRFDARVLALMAASAEAPLALSNLALRDKVGAAHIHITRHLALQGSRLTELAQAAGMSKQAMADLVDQCEAWGLVTRQPTGDVHGQPKPQARQHRGPQRAHPLLVLTRHGPDDKQIVRQTDHKLTLLDLLA